MEIGDRVLYIYNVPWENKKKLTGSIGIIYDINDDGIYDDDGDFICDEYYGCHWTAKNSDVFDWWVPEIHIRKLKQSELR